jgi:hypothetical protein
MGSKLSCVSGTEMAPPIDRHLGLASGPAARITEGSLKSIRALIPVPHIEQGTGSMLTSHPRAEHRTRRLGGIVRFTNADKRHWQVDETGALSELPNRDEW